MLPVEASCELSVEASLKPSVEASLEPSDKPSLDQSVNSYLEINTTVSCLNLFQLTLISLGKLYDSVINNVSLHHQANCG